MQKRKMLFLKLVMYLIHLQFLQRIPHSRISYLYFHEWKNLTRVPFLSPHNPRPLSPFPHSGNVLGNFTNPPQMLQKVHLESESICLNLPVWALIDFNSLNLLFKVIFFCTILCGEEKNYAQSIKRELKFLHND